MRHLSRTVTFSLALLVWLVWAGCGFLAEKGEESRGNQNLPSQGVGPWAKYDLNCPEEQDLPPGKSPDTSVQPVLIRVQTGHVYSEPWVVSDSEELTIYYEDRTSEWSRIRRASLAMGPRQYCRPAEFTVLEDTEVFLPREEGFEVDPTTQAKRVGAPTILKGVRIPGIAGLDATYAMYYMGGDGQGIGLAVSPDGKAWTRVGPDGLPSRGSPQPLIVPIEGGWEQGTVGSPSILLTPAGRFLLYFDGNRHASRSIGLAASEDGIRWMRIDAEGREGNLAGPILTPTFYGSEKQTNWEFFRSYDPDSGSVGSPMALIDHGPIRDVYLLYYTGNLRGPLIDNYDDVDTSVGIASSLDGISFTKASTTVDYPKLANEVNPILAEHFALCVSNSDLSCLITAFQPLFDYFWGPAGYCRQEENKNQPICNPRVDGGDGSPGSGSSNSTSPFFIVDEAEASVARFGEEFVMFYHQQSDAMGFLSGRPFDNGIAIALNNFN